MTDTTMEQRAREWKLAAQEMLERANKAERERDRLMQQLNAAADVEGARIAEADDLRVRLAMVTEALVAHDLFEDDECGDGFRSSDLEHAKHCRELLWLAKAKRAVSATEADVSAWLAAKRREWRVEGANLVCPKSMQDDHPYVNEEAVDAYWPEDKPK